MDMTHFTFKVTVYEWTVYAVIGQTCPALSPAAAVSSVAVLSPSAGCCSHSAGWSSLSAVYQSAALSLTSETHTPSSGSHSPSAAAPARSLHHTRTIKNIPKDMHTNADIAHVYTHTLTHDATLLHNGGSDVRNVSHLLNICLITANTAVTVVGWT